MQPAAEATAVIDWVHDILKTERDLVIESTPLEATAFEVEGIRMAYVFYERLFDEKAAPGHLTFD